MQDQSKQFEIEQRLLGALLIDPVKAGLPKFIGTLKTAHFSSLIHAMLYENIIINFVRNDKSWTPEDYGLVIAHWTREYPDTFKDVGNAVQYVNGLAYSLVAPYCGIDAARDLFALQMAAA